MSDEQPPSAPAEGCEHVAALPKWVTEEDPLQRWGALEVDRRDDALSRQQVYDRTEREIVRTIKYQHNAIIDAIMGSGKTTGFANAAATLKRDGIQSTYLTPRRELMREMKSLCEERGLQAKVLPSFVRDCPSANPGHQAWEGVAAELSAGLHGDILDLYERGLSPKELHMHGERWLGQPLPCAVLDSTCPYSSMWGGEGEQDVLIGHYVHAHVPSVVSDRAVVFDEFPEDAFLVTPTTSSVSLQETVSRYLSETDGLPFNSYTGLLVGKGTPAAEEAKDWFEEDVSRLKPGPDGVEAGHASTPSAVYTLLAASRLNNGWGRTWLPVSDWSKWVGVHNPEGRDLRVLMPPVLSPAHAVVCLDGTPTKRLWEVALGRRLRLKPVLSDAEKRDFVRNCLGLQVVVTTEALKPYSGGNHVNVDQDAALLETIDRVEGQLPDLISTKAALSQYEDAGLFGLVGSRENYGNLTSSNQFAESRLGCVVGSRHYGDDYIELWGALVRESVEANGKHGHERAYGDFGDKVLTHMREHQTLQAVMRFGRDGGGARIYVHTDTLPDWFPVASRGRVVKPWSDGMKEVISAITNLGDCTAREIAEHPGVGIGLRQVQNNVRELERRGFVQKSDEQQGNAFVYRDGGLHRSRHGVAELGLEGEAKRAAELFEPGDPIEGSELTTEQAHEVWHGVPYASEFVL
jgi:hypothetical protein